VFFRPIHGYNWNLIHKTLLQGSRPPTGHQLHDHGIDVLILCAEEFQPPASEFPGVEVIHAGFDDNPGRGLLPQEVVTADRAARLAAMHVRRGKVVLVTCMAGLNRSGLVTAKTVCRLTGWSGLAAARHIKERRPMALFNPHFMSHLATVHKRERRI
jgi:protein-tyrosine phosphatase